MKEPILNRFNSAKHIKKVFVISTPTIATSPMIEQIKDDDCHKIWKISHHEHIITQGVDISSKEFSESILGIPWTEKECKS